MTTSIIDNLNIKIFSDGAKVEDIINLIKNPLIKGVTTNPSLMRKAGIVNYKDGCTEILKYVKDIPVSIEVISDDIDEMYEQGLELASWGENVCVKIPITNTKSESSLKTISKLLHKNVYLNITAIFQADQIFDLVKQINDNKIILSIFAGRIADSGRDPKKIIKEVQALSLGKNTELLWASTREAYNIVEANDIGCDIITVSPSILNKLDVFNKDLLLYSLETVKMFYEDAKKSNYII